ncbi:MAG: trypsin-like peptidase domain-containing protein, partial [Clostridia bacterium]|nr:trypsin-like peptidase domain-containing protein [Clostridia bacterium]
GSTVYAIGNPGGSALFGTFTDGKVSAIGRNITSSIGYDMVCIQHNAAISPGNSGGALVNEYGQVIGINSAKIAATEYEGISFAIPITQAKEIIDKVIAYGYVPGRPKLGISYVANDSSAISGIYSMAVQMMDLPSGSLVIYSIDNNSALAGTEAQPGDMIVSVNGKDLDKADVLLEMIEDSSVGDVLTLELFRITTSGGRYHTEELTVKAKLIEENNTKVEETTTAGVYGNDDYGFGGYDFGFDFGF